MYSGPPTENQLHDVIDSHKESILWKDIWGPNLLNKSVSVTRVGIKNEEEGYEPTNTAYENAAPGVGAVLRKHEYLSLWLLSLSYIVVGHFGKFTWEMEQGGTSIFVFH